MNVPMEIGVFYQSDSHVYGPWWVQNTHSRASLKHSGLLVVLTKPENAVEFPLVQQHPSPVLYAPAADQSPATSGLHVNLMQKQTNKLNQRNIQDKVSPNTEELWVSHTDVLKWNFRITLGFFGDPCCGIWRADTREKEKVVPVLRLLKPLFPQWYPKLPNSSLFL